MNSKSRSDLPYARPLPMSGPKLVELNTRSNAAEIISALDALKREVEDGKVDTVFIFALRPDGGWVQTERGKHLHALTRIGLLECLKAEIVDKTDTGVPSGL